MKIDESLVAALIADQFPQWAGLPLSRVRPGGWDNRTFRLGEDLLVRLPSAAAYAAQVDKEQRWLPWLAPRLPLAIPEPLAQGRPAPGYPWPWSVYRWIAGAPARGGDRPEGAVLARDLAGFLTALQGLDAADGPPAGTHNFHRGGDLAVYDSQTREALASLDDPAQARAAAEVWAAALDSRWDRAPVWIHGDMAEGNLLARQGRLCAVIDFGSCGTGDPACDLVPAWTMLDPPARDRFRQAMALNAACWRRARGWALWKALISLNQPPPEQAQAARTVIASVLADHAKGRTVGAESLSSLARPRLKQITKLTN